MAGKLCVYEKRIVLILLNFGDSWAHAVNVEYRYGYARMMAEKFDCALLDYSRASTSIAHMIDQLRNFLNNDYDPAAEYLALFFVTAKQRQMFFEENGTVAFTDYFNNIDEYYKYFYTEHLGNFSLNTHIITLQAICKQYNINDQYLLGWQYPELWPEVNRKKFYYNGNENAVTILSGEHIENFHEVENFFYSGHQHLISKDDAHPSTLGHQQIANKWTKYIMKNSLKPNQ
jgi:hypothetical protein